MIVLETRPSRLLPWLLSGGHAAAAFSFTWALGGGIGLLAVLGVIGLSLFLALRCAAPCRLGLEEDGRLVLAPGVEEAPRRAVLLPESVVLGAVVWLVWREEEGARRGVRMILRDELSLPAWRALQVWLRLRARSRLDSGRSR